MLFLFMGCQNSTQNNDFEFLEQEEQRYLQEQEEQRYLQEQEEQRRRQEQEENRYQYEPTTDWDSLLDFEFGVDIDPNMGR